MLDKLGGTPRIVLLAAVLAIAAYTVFTVVDPLDAGHGNAPTLIPLFCLLSAIVSFILNFAWDAFARRRGRRDGASPAAPASAAVSPKQDGG